MAVFGTILGTQQQPETPVALSYDNYFVDEVLSRNEGREPHQSIEDYSITGAYGIKNRPKKYEKLPAREAARLMTLDKREEIKSQIGERNWERMPMSVKLATQDFHWNTNSLFTNFKKNLIKGDYENALYETFDAVSASDKESGKKGVLRGLANRRAKMFNRYAIVNKLPKVTEFEFTKGEKGGTNVTYYFEGNKKPITKFISKGIHPDSKGADTETKGYEKFKVEN